MTQRIDILALTETWIGPVDRFLHISHKVGKRSGDVAIIYSSGFNVTINQTGVYTYFEHMDCSVSMDGQAPVFLNDLVQKRRPVTVPI